MELFFLLLFSVHLLAYALLYVKNRQSKDLLVCAVFVALSAFYGLRVAAFDLQVMGLSLQSMLRVTAWLLAAASLSWMGFRYLNRNR